MLETGDKKGSVTFSTTILPLAGKQNQNGFVVFSGGEPRGQMMRIGLQVRQKQVIIMGPQWQKVAARMPFAWDGKTPVAMKVQVNFEEHQVTVDVAGKVISAPMPKAWTSLRSWGFGANNAEAVFTPLQFQ